MSSNLLYINVHSSCGHAMKVACKESREVVEVMECLQADKNLGSDEDYNTKAGKAEQRSSSTLCVVLGRSVNSIINFASDLSLAFRLERISSL